MDKFQAPYRRDGDAFETQMNDNIQVNSMAIQMEDIDAKVRQAKFFA